MKKSIEEEVEDALHKLPSLHQKIIKKTQGIEEEIELLQKEINKLLKQKTPNSSTQTELIPRLCLLSELCSAISFEKMIEARELFLETYPDHFKCYLEQQNNKVWEVQWSGCLNCTHFLDRCNLNLRPREKKEKGRVEMDCPSYKPRRRS